MTDASSMVRSVLRRARERHDPGPERLREIRQQVLTVAGSGAPTPAIPSSPPRFLRAGVSHNARSFRVIVGGLGLLGALALGFGAWWMQSDADTRVEAGRTPASVAVKAQPSEPASVVPASKPASRAIEEAADPSPRAAVASPASTEPPRVAGGSAAQPQSDARQPSRRQAHPLEAAKAGSARGVPAPSKVRRTHPMQQDHGSAATRPERADANSTGTVARREITRTSGRAGRFEPVALRAKGPGTARTTLAAEIEPLRKAGEALERGELQRARNALQRHREAYPAGQLQAERLALTTRLHCASGDTEAARRALRALARLSPGSLPVAVQRQCAHVVEP